MQKIKVNDDLIKKALAAFCEQDSIYTGEGLSRGELRALWRAGLVQRALGGGAGPEKNIWIPKEELWAKISLLNQ